MTKILKIVGVVVVLIGLLFILLNQQYVLAQLKYRMHWLGQDNGSLQGTSTDSDRQAEVSIPANSIYIPSLAIKAPIVYPEGNTEQDFQKALLGGVAKYPGTADFGKPGNPYLFGHSSDFLWSKGKYKSVFALLPQIKIADKVYVSGQDSITHTYEVAESFVAAKTDVHLLDQGGYKEAILTIQTSYPLGTALKRYIVKAKLVE